MKWILSRIEWTLVLAGFCLLLLQFFMIRELTALLRGTEVVILLVTLAYFSGYSVGYGVAGRLSQQQVKKLALVAWLVHLTLPFSFRYVGGLIIPKAAGAGLVTLLFLSSFALSAFYSILLPRFIDQARDGHDSLPRYYGLEIAGAVMGLLTLFLVGHIPVAVPFLYQAALATVVGLLWWRPFTWFLTTAGLLAYILAYRPLEQHSLWYRFATIHAFRDHQILYSVNSIYQKVDILRNRKGHPYIYLDGLKYFGSKALSAFNTFLSRLPARLIQPREALILGSGSLESVKYVSQFAKHVTTCELDPAVVTGSRLYLADINQLDTVRNWTLVINDSKQFLGTTTGRYDLIIADVPAPLTIQVGLLHSVEFYRLIKQRLTTNGVVSVCLSGTFSAENETPLTVAASMLAVFNQILIYTPREAQLSFAIAGNALPFSRQELAESGKTFGASYMQIFDQPEIVKLVNHTPPLSAGNMSFVVRKSWSRLTERFTP